MKVEFTDKHTLKENRKSYKKGDTENVSSSIAERLISAGVAKAKTTTKEK